MFFMLASASLVSSLVLWAGYQAFLVPDDLHPVAQQGRAIPDLFPGEQPPPNGVLEETIVSSQLPYIMTRQPFNSQDSNNLPNFISESPEESFGSKYNQHSTAELSTTYLDKIATAYLYSSQIDSSSRLLEEMGIGNEYEGELHTIGVDGIAAVLSHSDISNIRHTNEDHETVEQREYDLLGYLELEHKEGHLPVSTGLSIISSIDMLFTLYSLIAYVEFETTPSASDTNNFIRDSKKIPSTENKQDISTKPHDDDFETIPSASDTDNFIRDSKKIPNTENKQDTSTEPYDDDFETIPSASDTDNFIRDSKKIPNAENKQDTSTEPYDDDSEPAKSPLMDKYMSKLGWEAYAVISISALITVLLISSLIIFGSRYCRTRKSPTSRAIHANKTI